MKPNLIIAYLLVISIMLMSALYMTSCNHGFPMPDDVIIVPNPPDPVVLDTCDPGMITDPPFVTAYMEITDVLQTDIKIHIGPYTAVVSQDDPDELWHHLDSLFELYNSTYHYLPEINADDMRRFSVHVDGTNDKTQFHLKTYIEYNGQRHYFGWSSQGFVYLGSHSPEAYEKQALNYPSVRIFNYYGTDGAPGWDSMAYVRCDSIILGDTCKIGRDWADFRWGIHSDAMVQRFIDQGWGTVLSAYPGKWAVNRSLNGELFVGRTLDLRGECVADSYILYYLNLGYQVITDQ